jgi:hypothetical protein
MKKADFLQRIKALPDAVSINYPDKGNYIGQIGKDKLRHGKGFYTYADGDIYFGGWKEDDFYGQGVYIFSNG